MGRDFKVVAQLSLFVLAPYQKQKCGLHCPRYIIFNSTFTYLFTHLITQLFKLEYCDKLYLERINEYRDASFSFVQTVQRNCPSHRKKPKLHLLMHLPEYIELFGHPSSYNTER